jgi:hypothetical protein
VFFFCYSLILILVFVILLLIIYFFILLYYEVHGVCLFFFFVLLSAPTLPHKQQAGGEREKRERRGTNDGETRILMPPSTRPFSPRGVSPYLALEHPAQEALDNEAQGPLEALEKQKNCRKQARAQTLAPACCWRRGRRTRYFHLLRLEAASDVRGDLDDISCCLTRMAFTPCEN